MSQVTGGDSKWRSPAADLGLPLPFSGSFDCIFPAARRYKCQFTNRHGACHAVAEGYGARFQIEGRGFESRRGQFAMPT